MNKIIIITGSIALSVAVAVVACQAKTKTPSSRTEGLVQQTSLSNDSLIKRGSYLVTIMGCDDCHSPKLMGPKGPEVDTKRRLSGHPANQPLAALDTANMKSWVLMDMGLTAAVGPWGISYAPNITSDQTGIGSWSEEQFFTAIRKGKYKGLEGSRSLLPPMPWYVYAQATDEDLKAIFAFLKSTQPIENTAPEPVAPQKLTAMR